MEIDKNLAGLPAKEIPPGMTRNLWGSVKCHFHDLGNVVSISVILEILSHDLSNAILFLWS